jgi:hypothetical protein
MGVAEGINLVLLLLEKATTMAAALSKAHAEGRDLTEAEVDTFVAADDAARDKLNEAIKNARSQGR